MLYLARNPTARDHERRCKALRYRARDPYTGERVQCAKYALRGGDYCFYHEKHRARCRGPTHNAKTTCQKDATMPAAFSRHLSQTLKQRLAELEGNSPSELIDLTTELTSAKVTMGDVMQLYDLTLLALEQAPPEEQLACLRAVISTGHLVRETALEIGDVAGKAAGAMAACRHFLGIQNIPVLVNQWVNIMYEELGEENADAVARIAERIKEVRMPDGGPRGTRLTPEMADEEARMMDASVPRVEHDEHDDAA